MPAAASDSADFDASCSIRLIDTPLLVLRSQILETSTSASQLETKGTPAADP